MQENNEFILSYIIAFIVNRFRKVTSELDRFRHTTAGIVNAQRFAPKVNLKIHLATEPAHIKGSGRFWTCSTDLI
jgi:hypothetical protein